MFARFVHTLTLLAFAAHAAFGCCGHHQHRHESVDCCHHSDHTDASACCESTEVCAGNGCNHESHDEVSLPPTEVTSEMIDGLDTIALESVESESEPCNHSHRCNETRCNFVASPSKAIELNSASCVLIDSVCYASHIESTMVSLVSRTLLHSELASFNCSLDRCAHLQSWQI